MYFELDNVVRLLILILKWSKFDKCVLREVNKGPNAQN